MTIPAMSPADAKARLESGRAVLVDVREANEHARENIPAAKLAPLSATTANQNYGKPVVIFHCQSGRRTAENASRLAACEAPEIYLLEGGLNAWKAAGYPVVTDRTRPIEIQRQVQIAAGTLVLLGAALALLVSIWFMALCVFVGAGLTFAGLTGWCGMARLLGVMPWNRMAA